MKRVFAIIIALVMAAALMPAAIAGGVSGEEISVTYTGATVNATNLSAGGTFNFTLGVSANSAMWSGHWEIDYPEEYVTPTAYSFTWSGSLMSQIQQTIDNDTQTSDVPAFVCALTNEEVADPGAEIDNYYTIIGMYLSSFDFGGMQAGGNFARITYRMHTIPDSADISHDASGYYMEFPIIVRESTYWTPGMQIGAPGSFLDHETVNVVNGKVYVRPMHTVNFYGFNGELLKTQRVRHGNSASAPTVPSIVTANNGPYVFYGWDGSYTNVQSNIDIHALYTLLGDVNIDGVVDSVDALMSLRKALTIDELTAQQIAAADINMDGEVRSDDALTILRYSLGILDGLL